MKVFVPYTEVDPLTFESLRDIPWQCVKMEGRGAYPLWLSSMWGRAEGWINIEHDIVVPPGAIESLQQCSEPWCAHTYVGEPSVDKLESVFIGLAKFSSEFVQAISPVWPHGTHRLCDFSITKAARTVGFEVHEHAPSVRNLGYERRPAPYLAADK